MANNGTAADTRSPVLSWIALGVVYLVWGSTYLAIRVGVGHLPPLLFAGTRYVIAGALLYPIALRATANSGGSAQGRTKPGAKAWFAGAVIGILLLFAGNGGVTIGETTLPSGFAAVLVASGPARCTVSVAGASRTICVIIVCTVACDCTGIYIYAH